MSAALQLRNDNWRVLFRYKGMQYTYPIGKVSELEHETGDARTLSRVRPPDGGTPSPKG
jgi:hypothetical protein